MRHEEKLDYLLRVIHQYPEMSYSDIYVKLDKAMIWDEYIKLIKELVDHHCLAYDFYLGVRLTEEGRYKLIHPFTTQETAQQQIHRLKAKERKVSNYTNAWHVGLSFFNLYHMCLNKISLHMSKYLPREKG